MPPKNVPATAAVPAPKEVLTDSCKHKPEGSFPPAFWTAVSDGDKKLLSRRNEKRHFDAGLVAAVAARCRWGFPQSVVCLPVTAEGTPFPTLFWLTCPYLERKCGELESQRLIAEVEKILAGQPDEVAAWHWRYCQLRTTLLRSRLSASVGAVAGKTEKRLQDCGVGGINWHANPFAAKCLHLQAATWLGMREHPASDWLADKIGPTSCDSAICNSIAAAETNFGNLADY